MFKKGIEALTIHLMIKSNFTEGFIESLSFKTISRQRIS
jgi:hypothetical protein